MNRPGEKFSPCNKSLSHPQPIIKVKSSAVQAAVTWGGVGTQTSSGCFADDCPWIAINFESLEGWVLKFVKMASLKEQFIDLLPRMECCRINFKDIGNQYFDGLDFRIDPNAIRW